MRIAIFENTPAQIHLYKNVIRNLVERGHTIRILLRHNIESLAIYHELNLNYWVYSQVSRSKIGKFLQFPQEILSSWRCLVSFRPDIVMGGGIYGAYSSRLVRRPFVEFRDGESIASPLYAIEVGAYSPLTKVVITPAFFVDDLGYKHVKVKSLKEMAYLHPKYFHPDDEVLSILGISKNEDFVVVRFNAFDAAHDVGFSGFTNYEKRMLIRKLEKYARVFVSCESDLPSDLKSYALPTPKSNIHDVLFFAKLLVGDTGTMTSEAACLGTPAVFLHRSAKILGNFIELEKRYGLVFGYDGDAKSAMDKAVELVKRSGIKAEWQEKRRKLLDDCIDLTSFLTWFIERYPSSLRVVRENPDFQNRFY